MCKIVSVLLGLFIVIGAIHMMYGDTTGSLRMPVGQFVGKAMLTAILIHLSALIGEAAPHPEQFVMRPGPGKCSGFRAADNNGQLFNDGQALVLAIVMTIVFGIGLFRVIFQAIKRVILFNLLFVLSGPAFLTSLHPATAPVFSAWMRMYVATIFEQFILFLTLD